MAGKKLPKGISIRPDGRYQARYTLNGKRYTIYGKTQKEVEKKLRDAQYEIDHGIYAKPERITVDAWYKTWLKEYREDNIIGYFMVCLVLQGRINRHFAAVWFYLGLLWICKSGVNFGVIGVRKEI